MRWLFSPQCRSFSILALLFFSFFFCCVPLLLSFILPPLICMSLSLFILQRSLLPSPSTYPLWSAHPSLLLRLLPRAYFSLLHGLDSSLYLSPFIYINEQKSSFHLPPDEQTLHVEEDRRKEEQRNRVSVTLPCKLDLVAGTQHYINSPLKEEII